MALKIRLSRGGAKKKPFYRIVVAETTSPRDGKFVEKIGSYNPMVDHDNKERLVIDGERVKYWISKGAKPTLRVSKLISKDGLVDKPIINEQPKKSAPGKKRLEREAEEAKTEAPAAEEAKTEVPAEEAKTEAPAEEAKTEAPAEEAKTEAPAAEEAKTEAPAAEEAKTEAPAAEEAKTEASAEEAKTEAPAEEEKKS
ncbi:MAG: 30S ribosomal protein S16 [Alphaproteobacteria bacterium]|nr:MAG: 30S ribosomal protein S16 [Alphaproteobacteria bacterium]